MATDLHPTLLTILVGNGSVGKSTLTARFTKGVFIPEYKKTIGVDYAEREIPVRVRTVRELKKGEQADPALDGPILDLEKTRTYEYETPTMMLWDCAGQSEFDPTTQKYYKDGIACIIACSATDQQSYNDIMTWHAKVKSNCNQDLIIVLALNKSELELQNQAVQVKRAQVEETATKMGFKFFPISVKDNTNVDELFRFIARTHLEKIKLANAMQKSIVSGGRLPGTTSTKEMNSTPPIEVKTVQEISAIPRIEAQPAVSPTKGKTGFFSKLKASLAA